MITIGRTWKLYAAKYESGALWHTGEHWWVKLFGLEDPIVPVLVEEIIGDDYASEVTHYAWEDFKRPSKNGNPEMVQIRTGTEPKRAKMLLEMCFPYGLKVEVDHGGGKVIALRITERSENAC